MHKPTVSQSLRVLVVTVFLIALSATSGRAQQRDSLTAAGRDSLLRARYPSLPTHPMVRYGATLGTADTATFAIAEDHVAGRDILWLGRKAARVAGTASWTVMDVLELPELSDEEWVMLALCGPVPLTHEGHLEADNVKLDTEIVAIVRAGEADVLTDILHAWRADRMTGRFKLIEVAAIGCLNDRTSGG